MFQTKAPYHAWYYEATSGASTGFPFNSDASLIDWYAMLDMGGEL